MNLTPRAMADEIASTGFGAGPLEKVKAGWEKRTRDDDPQRHEGESPRTGA
jgi:hypothetical protein